MQTRDGVADNISWIAEKFPNCITEKIEAATGEVKLAVDFDMLRQELSSEIVEGKDDRYQFVWPDKKKAILLANAPINATLRPCEEESEDFANTQNLYIEGDNLDVLKCLKETYLGKVKMIYIDPPYNTGNDFIYNDDFAESAEDYLANSGQYDEQGNRLVTNTESNGRFHTDWLNMIYPRLKVSRDLLKDEGVIFISIDDNEYENLKKICDEIFGASNFIANIIWEKSDSPRMDAKLFSTRHDYVLVYAKKLTDNIIKKSVSSDTPDHYDKVDENGKKYYLKPLRYMGTADAREDRPNLYFPIKAPNGNLVYPKRTDGSDGRWRWSQDKVEKEFDKLVFLDGRNGISVQYKIYAEEVSEVPYETIWFNSEVGSNRTAMAQLKKLFTGEKPFTTPKPIELLRKMLNVVETSNEIIMDFFAGSATTAHAVMLQNSIDQKKRKYILIQLPESIDPKDAAYKAGYKNLCDVGKERIRRASKKIKEDTGADIDYGFRVLKLDSSNMEDVYYAPSEVKQKQLTLFADNVKPDRTGEDLLFQSMLDLGATLDSKIEKMNVNGKVVYNVADGYLVACFDKEVSDDVVKAIAQMQPQYAVMRDSSLADDSTATNFEQIFKTFSPTTTCKIL